MPVYRFIVHGEGIRTDTDSIGFFASRSTSAQDKASARVAVLASIEADWRTGKSASLSPGFPPSLTAIRAWEVVGRDRGPQEGYCFYDDDDSAEKALEIELEAAHAPKR